MQIELSPLFPLWLMAAPSPITTAVAQLLHLKDTARVYVLFLVCLGIGAYATMSTALTWMDFPIQSVILFLLASGTYTLAKPLDKAMGKAGVTAVATIVMVAAAASMVMGQPTPDSLFAPVLPRAEIPAPPAAAETTTGAVLNHVHLIGALIINALLGRLLNHWRPKKGA